MNVSVQFVTFLGHQPANQHGVFSDVYTVVTIKPTHKTIVTVSRKLATCVCAKCVREWLSCGTDMINEVKRLQRYLNAGMSFFHSLISGIDIVPCPLYQASYCTLHMKLQHVWGLF